MVSAKGDVRRVCVLGTGLMGAPIARRLAGAGFEVRVWNRTPAKAFALQAHGCHPRDDLVEATAGADVIVSLMTDGKALRDVVSQALSGGGLRPGCLWIDMSSTLPSDAIAQSGLLRGAGVDLLDAPVSGGVKGAEAGTLAIMAGGGAQTFQRALAVFAPLGRAVWVGPSGSGQMAKLANQMIVAGTIGLVAEAMLFLAEGGADGAAVRDALQGGFADSVILRQHGQRMQDHNYVPGGSCANQAKDLDNALTVAGNLSLDLPMIAQVRARYHRLIRDLGGGALDHSALYLELCDLNGKGISAS